VVEGADATQAPAIGGDRRQPALEASMTRDMDLIREILRAVESRDESVNAERSRDHLQIRGYDDRVVALHVKLMEDADFLEANFIEADGYGIVFARPYRLKWKGYEFLAAASNESAWTQAKALVKANGANIPFSVLQSLLVEAAKKAVGV
jgi:hypothetical protein